MVPGLSFSRRRIFLIAITGFVIIVVAVVADLIRPEFTREFVVVFLSDWPFSADHSPTLGSAGDVFTVSSPLGKWLIELPDDNPFRGDPHDVQFCPYCGKSLDDDATT
jgi:hypothetical protein